MSVSTSLRFPFTSINSPSTTRLPTHGHCAKAKNPSAAATAAPACPPHPPPSVRYPLPPPARMGGILELQLGSGLRCTFLGSLISFLPSPLRTTTPFPSTAKESQNPSQISVNPSSSRSFQCSIRPRPSSSVPRAKTGKKEHHLWMKRDSAGSGQKALHLVQIVSKLPNDKDTIYGALDKWSAFELEFPVVAAAKALGILRKRKQWLRLIQVGKWLLSKGQCMTMGTYDLLLLAFDMDKRIVEAEFVWNTILQKYTCSVPKRLFSRMISLYDHHRMPEKILEVFADMEELRVKPDEDTVRRIAKAFRTLGKDDEQKEFYRRYGMKWKYIHFNGERVRVKTNHAD